MKIHFQQLLSPVIIFWVMIITLTPIQLVKASTINVLTFNGGGAGSFDFLTGGRFNNVRDTLTNTANYGAGGIVQDTVNYLPSVTAFNATNLGEADVVILANTSRPINEINALNNFVLNGGGILTFSNDAADNLGPILGSTFLNYLDGVNIQVSNGLSPIANGLFGVFAAGTTTGTSFGGLFDVVGPDGTVGITRAGTPFAATYDFGPRQGRVAVFLDEEMFVSASLGGADARWNTTHNAYFLNAFEYVNVPEPKTWILLIIGIISILSCRTSRLKSTNT